MTGEVVTTTGEAARVLLFLRLIKDAVDAEITDRKKAALPLFDVGDKKVASHDGVPLGKVECRDGGGKAEVTDRAALLAWAREKHPVMVQTGEDLAPLTDALLHVQDGGAVTLDSEAGRLIVDAAYKHLGYVQRVQHGKVGNLYPAAETALLENVAKNDGLRVDNETGESEKVPGVEYTPLPPSLYVTPDKKKGAPELVQRLMTSGLPALPAIEAPDA